MRIRWLGIGCGIGAASVCLLALAGCSNARSVEAEQVASQLAASVGEDPATACRLLTAATLQQLEKSEKKPCVEALPELEISEFGELRSTNVYGLQAQLHFDAQTVFLTLEDGSWKVAAAGCQPRVNDLPYECELQKG